MSRVRPEDTIVVEEMETNPERFFKNLNKLAWIVLHNHYNYVRDYATQEDMVSEAVLKAWELLRSGQFDPSRSSIRNYCYSGMRNQMQNFIYKKSKEVSVEEIFYTGEDEQKSELDKSCEIDPVYWDGYIEEELVYDICDRFYRLGGYHDILIDRLLELGLKGSYTEIERPKRVSKFISDVCFIEYLWRVVNESRK